MRAATPKLRFPGEIFSISIRIRDEMRTAESINLVVFIFLIGLAVVRPLPASRRVRAIATGLAGVGLILAARYSSRLLPPLASSVIRDWLPSPLLLMIYWQAGQFFVQPHEGIQSRLLELDRMFVDPILLRLSRGRAGRWILTYLEFAYLFCYLLVPSGIGVLYILHMGAYADRFWTAVLPPTYLCYVMVPFIQTLPPRVLEAPEKDARRRDKVRSLNLWILQHGSIHANTFPSAHVAASVATALALFHADPVTAFVFLCIAISIACGAVAGRYHYAADVLLGGSFAAGYFVLLRFLIAEG